MEFLGISRKKPQVGDIFVFKNKYKGYGWGRVILLEPKMGFGVPYPIKEASIIYVYNVFTNDISKIPELKRNNFLLPPLIINRRGWLDGYFQTIQNTPITQDDVFAQNMFKYKVKDELQYRNQEGVEINKTSLGEDCSWWGIGNHRTLDDQISIALNLPLAPVDDEDKDKIPKALKDNPDIKFMDNEENVPRHHR